MLHFILGAIIGSVMGLTGAGGALISIPLFMHFLQMDLKDASVYSLSAVIFASGINYLMQFKNAKIKETLVIVLVSGFGSYIVSPWKSQLSNWIIIVLLLGISLFALINVWSKKTPEKKSIQSSTSTYYYGVLIISGLVLGILTTFTGLGGGVLMVPVMLRFLHFSQKQAIASSLLAVAISSTFSLLVQIYHGFHFSMDIHTALLFLGMFVMALLLKFLLKHVSSHRMLLIQRIVFSLVVFISWIKLLN
jgi:uncharacterized membrane protein YfcA